jgi:hypothetical protein
MREPGAPVRSHTNTSTNAANPVKSGTSTNQKDPRLSKTIPCRTPKKKNIIAITVNESTIANESLKSLLSRKSAYHSSSLTAGNPPSTRAATTSPNATGANQSRMRMIHMMHIPSSCLSIESSAKLSPSLSSGLAWRKIAARLLTVTHSQQSTRRTMLFQIFCPKKRPALSHLY